jgi:hypothetical protein
MRDAKLRLFKVLRADGTTTYGRKGWTVPSDKPGKWMPKIKGDIIACENGYHLTDAMHITTWAREDDLRIVECDYRGEPVNAGDKWVVREARPLKCMAWDRRVLVAWACDCVERALAVWRNRYPKDKRPAECIATVRAWLRGEATIEQVRQARAAAADAAAAYAADAAAAVRAAAAADAAAAAAADAAAYAAAAAYARAKAREVEKAWQSDRLLAYLDGKATP